MVKLGAKAPAFSLPAADGTTVSLADFAGKQNVVVYFYPKDMTTGCTIEAQEFRDAVPGLARKNTIVLGVSRDSSATHCKFRDKYELNFPLLTDEDTSMMQAYGAWGDKVMYGQKKKGIIRSTVLIDTEGKVVKHWPKVKVAGHVDAVVAAVAELSGGGTPAASSKSTKAKPKAAKRAAKKAKKATPKKKKAATPRKRRR
jgi:peroxiredoxin Q/BCP